MKRTIFCCLTLFLFSTVFCQVNPDLVNLSNNTWKRMTPSFDPPGLGFNGFGHPHGESCLTFDEAAGVVVWFGGCSDGYTNQTWVYSVTDNKWTMANNHTYEDSSGIEKEWSSTWGMSNKLCSTLPNGMCNFGICYDSDAGLVIKHGGLSSGWSSHPGELASGVTFSFNGSTFEWKKAARWDGSSYSGTYTFGSYGLVYDTKYKKLIMFGGDANTVCGFTACDLTYAFDYAAGIWKRMQPSTKPPKCHHHSMAYLKKKGKTLALVNGQTWWYDYAVNSWTRKGSGPSATKAAMCYDSNNDVAILFKNGGTSVYDPETDNWQSMNPSPTPSSTQVWQLAFDPVNNVAVYVDHSWNTWVYRYKKVATTKDQVNHPNAPASSLLACSPNPFSSIIKISFAAYIKRAMVKVYNLQGRLIRKFASENGLNHLTWDGTDFTGKQVENGTYIIRLISGYQSHCQHVILLR